MQFKNNPWQGAKHAQRQRDQVSLVIFPSHGGLGPANEGLLSRESGSYRLYKHISLSFFTPTTTTTEFQSLPPSFPHPPPSAHLLSASQTVTLLCLWLILHLSVPLHNHTFASLHRLSD